MIIDPVFLLLLRGVMAAGFSLLVLLNINPNIP